MKEEDNRLDATVFVYRHGGRIVTAYADRARALDRSPDYTLLASLEPRRYIKAHYELIERWLAARTAQGTHSEECWRWHHECAIAEVERLRAAVVAEREACAKVAEETVCDTHLPTGVRIYGTRAADAIRARGKE